MQLPFPSADRKSHPHGTQSLEHDYSKYMDFSTSVLKKQVQQGTCFPVFLGSSNGQLQALTFPRSEFSATGFLI